MSWLEHTPFGALAAIPGAIVAALIAGTLLPLLGVWVVCQRVVFLGVTLAQVAAAGVALGLLLGWPPLPTGLLLCLAMVLLVARRVRGSPGGTGGTGGDSALGAAFCVASALALLFISRSPAELENIEHVLHGNLIFATTADVQRVTAALLAGLIVIALCFQRILFSAFDGETAAALGLRPRAWLGLLFGVLAVVLTLSMRTTGSVLTFALLVLPPLAALQFGRGLAGTFALSALLGLLGTVAGLLLAVRADLHLESSIVVTSFLLLPFVACWRRSPLLALALAAALGFVVPALAPELPGEPQMHPPHEHDRAPAATAPATPREPGTDLPPDVVALLAEAARAPQPAAPSVPTAPAGSGAAGANPPTTAAAATGPGGNAPHAAGLELSLYAQPAAEPNAVEVSWTLRVRRGHAPGPATATQPATTPATPPAGPPAPATPALPRALWLRTAGCGVTDERVIVQDTGRLPAGEQVLTGGFTLRGTTSVGPVAGELWSGPSDAETSAPVPDSVVYPSSAAGAHDHR